MNISKALVDDFCKTKEILEEKALSILKVLNSHEQIDGFTYLKFTDIDEDGVCFEGEETWGYGGYEHYSYYFPINLLYDENALQARINSITEIKLAKEEAEKQSQEELRLAKEKADYVKYLELKKKFND